MLRGARAAGKRVDVLILPSRETPEVQVVEVTAPSTVDYVVTTPGELMVEGYVIVSGEEGVEVDDGHDH